MFGDWIRASRAIRDRRQRRPLARKILDRIQPPKWMADEPDHGLREQYAAQRLLVKRGKIVWGCTVQANRLLFDPGDEDHPGVALFSPDPDFDEDPEMLEVVADALFDQKEREERDEELAEFGRILADELEMALNLRIPRSRTDGREVYYTSTLVSRKHLPNGYLSKRLYPYLVLPERTRASMILPCAYWPEELVRAWGE